MEPLNSLADAGRLLQQAAAESSRSQANEAANESQSLWNSLLLLSVFGHTEESLREVVNPHADLAYKLFFTGEDVLLAVVASTLSPAQVDAQLRQLRTALSADKRLLATGGIDGAQSDGHGTVTWKEDWSTAKPASAWSHPQSSAISAVRMTPTTSQNRWSLLGN